MLISSSSHKLRRVAAIGFAAIISIGLASCKGAGFGPPELQQEGTPDLIVGSPSASDSGPAAGVTFTLRATVRNLGDGASAATTLRYYRSTDATITTSDTQVGTDEVGELAASGTSDESVSLTAPATAGTYYYGVCVVAVTDESDTTNNCSSSVQLTVAEQTSQSGPDLVVYAIFINRSPASAPVAAFLLDAKVRNDGDEASPPTALVFYRSTDATITTSDTSVGTVEIEALAASGSSPQSVNLTAPASPGTYYYGACVDEVTDESDTTNNCSTSVAVTVADADQQGPSVEISAEDDKEWAPVGDTVDLSARVLDDEGEEITGTTVRWSSSNTAVATVDSSGVMTAVGEGTVTLTATATVSSSSTQSSMARSGAAVEKSEDTVSGSVRMTVVKRAARIDISPASLSFDSVGDSAFLTATVYDEDDNVMQPTYWGWSSADRDVATADHVFSSPQVQALVKAIGEGTTTVSLRANGSATGTASVTVTLPVARVEVSPIELDFEALGATKTVTVRVLDENGVEDEDASFTWGMGFGPCCGFEPGDTIKTLDIVRVDDGLEITAEGRGRGQITISSQDVESAIVLVRVYQVAASLTISPDSVSLAVDETATLRASVMDANGHDIPLAEGGKGGLVVYWETSDSDVATVDGADKHADRNTGATATVTAAAAGTATITGRHGSDVIGTATITVTVPVPDLVVAAPTVSNNAPDAGAAFTLSATVRNDGDEASAATTLRYYRSTGAIITTSDTEVGTVEVGALAASGTSGESISLTATLPAGTYYYGACVDAVTDESDTTNNCSSSVPVTVAPPAHPDLVIYAVTTGTNPFGGTGPGGLIQMSAGVRNQGSVASPATTLRFYQSTDATITTSDTEVGMDDVGALAASETRSHGADVHAPATTGTYYYGACVDAVTDEFDTTNNCSGSLPVEVS